MSGERVAVGRVRRGLRGGVELAGVAVLLRREHLCVLGVGGVRKLLLPECGGGAFPRRRRDADRGEVVGPDEPHVGLAVRARADAAALAVLALRVLRRAQLVRDERVAVVAAEREQRVGRGAEPAAHVLAQEVVDESVVVRLGEPHRRRQVGVHLDHDRLRQDPGAQDAAEERGVEAVDVNLQRVRVVRRAERAEARADRRRRRVAPRDVDPPARVERLQVAVQPLLERRVALHHDAAVAALGEQRERRVVARAVVGAEVDHVAVERARRHQVVEDLRERHVRRPRARVRRARRARQPLEQPVRRTEVAEPAGRRAVAERLRHGCVWAGDEAVRVN